MTWEYSDIVHIERHYNLVAWFYAQMSNVTALYAVFIVIKVMSIQVFCRDCFVSASFSVFIDCDCSYECCACDNE